MPTVGLDDHAEVSVGAATVQSVPTAHRLGLGSGFHVRRGVALGRSHGAARRLGVADSLGDDPSSTLRIFKDTCQQDVAERCVDQFGDAGTELGLRFRLRLGLRFRFLINLRGCLGLGLGRCLCLDFWLRVRRGHGLKLGRGIGPRAGDVLGLGPRRR